MASSGTSGARGSGTEQRLWAGPARPDGPVPARPDAETGEKTVWIETRDGTRLSALLIRPRDSARTPCVVVTNGYSGLDFSLLPYLRSVAAKGYAVVLARLRGVPPSEGKAGLYEDYGEDGYDVVEWAAAQDFCDGRVGMAGASLLGISQWFAARERPPHLKVIAPDDSPNDTYSYLWYQAGAEPGPGRRRRAEVPGVESEYGLASQHPWFDDFWREHGISRHDIQDVARSGLPALLSTGWDSYIVDAASRAYTWMREAGAGDRVRLVIGPWRHGGIFSNNPREDYALGPTVRPHTGFDIELSWLETWLTGGAGPLESAPPVLIYVQGPDEWRYEYNWPLPDERRTRLYLSGAASGTSASLNDGSLTAHAPAELTSAAYEYTPGKSANPVNVSAPKMQMVADGEPIALEEVLPPGSSRPHGRLLLDKRHYESDALTWTSPVLREPVEVTGYASLVVWAKVSRPDALFVAELMDAGPDAGGDGWAPVQVTRGYLRADAQFSRTQPTALRPQDVYRFEIPFSPTSYVVPAGHRLRVVVQGAATDPAVDLSWQGPGLPAEPFGVEILGGRDYGSYLDLPVIGTGILAET
jgi:putative CocE/NonD family hydrolase